MTKQEFAIKLLFWLFPGDISKALPRSLRIRYYGPSAQWDPGFIPPWDIGPSNIYDPYRIGPLGPSPPKPAKAPPYVWIDALDPMYWDTPGDGITWEAANNRWKYRCSYEAAHSLFVNPEWPGWEGFRPTHIKVTHFGDCGEINMILSPDVAFENNYLSGQIKKCVFPSGDITMLELVSTSLSVPWANFGYITSIKFAYEEE